MQKDKDIQQLFEQFHPKDGKPDFVQQLDKKMHVVDTIRGEHKRSSRLYRFLSVISLLTGFAVGFGLLSFASFGPLDWASILDGYEVFVPSFRLQMVAFLSHYADLILYTLGALSIILGLLPLMCTNDWEWRPAS